MLLGKTKKLLEDKETSITLNLSNNYKDAAFAAYNEFIALIEELRNNGKINDKDYEKLQKKVLDYRVKFKAFIK